MASDVDLALPGFEGLVVPDVDRAGAQDFTKKEYTAVRIRKDYPGTFQAVVRALFFYRLPVSTCADLFRMNCACVAAIRDMVVAGSASGGAAAFLANQRRHSQRDIAILRLSEAITEKLSDPKVLENMSVSELVDIQKRLEDAPPARNGTESGKRSSKDEIEDGEIIDGDVFDAAIAEVAGNGFNAEKSRARGSVGPAAADPAPESAAECSTRSAS